jgi:hypothetical protein
MLFDNIRIPSGIVNNFRQPVKISLHPESGHGERKFSMKTGALSIPVGMGS